MRPRPEQREPAGVPSAKQVGQALPQRWSWVEAQVWTARMLEALERGVKGGKWFSLIDKVYRPQTLMQAWLRVKANKGAAGVDHQSIEEFEEHLEQNLSQLHQQLKAQIYRPRSIRRVWIDKPGSRDKRPLGIPTVRDRVVETAIVLVIEPIFESQFAQHSYGYRPERSAHEALNRVESLLEQGHTHVVEIDFKSYFDSVDWNTLMGLVQEQIADSRLLGLIEMLLRREVRDGAERHTPDKGVPQGSVLSPVLANLYLNALDHQAQAMGLEMVRFADDLVLLCRLEQQTQQAWQLLEMFCLERKLELHPEKSRQVDMAQSGAWFEFLGYRFERGKMGGLYKVVSPKSIKKLRAKIRPKTRRLSGRSLDKTIEEVNQILRGWFEYFKHAQRTGLIVIDRWLRRRLRSILRKNNGLKGISKGGKDHHRWTNNFFRDRGLFFLEDAHVAFFQSSER